MTGPRKIIDLDSPPNNKRKLVDSALHLYQNKLWHWEKVGCILCAADDVADYKSQTLRSDDDKNVLVCLTHGNLEAVEVKVERSFAISIGGVTRNGSVISTDEVLFPVSISATERENIITQMFDQIEIEERLTHEKSTDE